MIFSEDDRKYPQTHGDDDMTIQDADYIEINDTSGEESYFSNQPPLTGGENSDSDRGTESDRNTMYVTRRTYFITLVVAMLITSLATMGIYSTLVHAGLPGISEPVTQTNYSLAKSTKSPKSAEEIIARNANSVVEIRTESIARDSLISNYVRQGAGSGVVVSDDGYIVTNNHVIDGAGKITVTLKNHKTYSAKLIGKDRETDLAVIKINAIGLPPVIFGDSSQLQVGQFVIAIGNPLGQLGGTATSGIISALDRKIQIDGRTMVLLQTDASINPGNSGGGLFDSNGNLAGVVVAKSQGSDVEGLGFAIPVDKVKPIINDLVKNGRVTGRPQVGIQIFYVPTKEDAAELGLSDAGVYVKDVVSKNALKADIQSGDQLIALDGKKVSTAEDFIELVRKKKVGDTVKLTISRSGKSLTVEIKLSEAQ